MYAPPDPSQHYVWTHSQCVDLLESVCPEARGLDFTLAAGLRAVSQHTTPDSCQQTPTLRAHFTSPGCENRDNTGTRL